MKNVMNPINTPTMRFKDGNPATGEYGTIVTATFLNDVQDSVINTQQELHNVLTEAGVVADDKQVDQVVKAIKKIAGKSVESHFDELLEADGYKLVGSCKSVSELRTIRPTEHGQRILVDGYYEGGTTGGGEFVADLQDMITPDDGGTCFVVEGGNAGRWKRIMSGSEISAFDFGAVGDGVQDNSRALQAMIDYINSHGMRAFIPKGIYLVQSRIGLSSGNNVHIRGAGMGLSVIKRNNYSGSVLRFHNISGLLIQDLSIDGNEFISPGGGAGLDCANLINAVIERIEAFNCANSGIWVISGKAEITNHNVHIRNCFSHDTKGSGIQIQGAKASGISQSRAVNCGLGGNSVSGIYFKVPVEDCYHSDNYAQDIIGAAFAVGSSFPGQKAKRLTFTNCRAINCGYGMRLGEVEDVQVTNITALLRGEGNNIHGAVGDGFRLELTAKRVFVKNASIFNVAKHRAAVRCVHNATDNYIELAGFNSPQGESRIAAFDEGCQNNTVKIITQDDSNTLPDINNGQNNRIIYRERIITQTAHINESQSLMLVNDNVRVIRLDISSTNGNNSSDDEIEVSLSHISPSYDGHIITLQTSNDKRDIVLTNTGNIWIKENAESVKLNYVRESLSFIFNKKLNKWCQMY